MDFRTVLIEALTICGKHADDPFLLYSTLCDLSGCDFALVPLVQCFHSLNQRVHLVEEIMQNSKHQKIVTLLEKSKTQTEVSEKLCLNWIHTLFEFYYRANMKSAPCPRVLSMARKGTVLEQEQKEHSPSKEKAKQKTVVPKPISQIKIPIKRVDPCNDSANKAPSISQITVMKRKGKCQSRQNTFMKSSSTGT